MSKNHGAVDTMTDVFAGGDSPARASAYPERECTAPWRPSSTPSSTWPNGAGFVYPSGEIYGGTKSAWDYGPLGVELKENIKRQWWRSVVTGRDDVVGLDSSIILPRQVWVASGHVEVFHDPLVESLITHKRYRADHLIEAYEAKHGHPPPNGLADIRDPETGEPGQWTEPREFNMMLKTYLGPIETEEGLHYLRPETAQGIFVNFANVVTTARRKPPFGIAQIGKSFRNEITPGNFIFRTREFEQMEMEFFVEPSTAKEWHQYWIDTRHQWYVDLGINPENLRLYEHPKDKLSHYSDRTVDVEYKFGFQGNPWGELEGVANRTDFDLSTHAKHSGADLSFYDQVSRHPVHALRDRAGSRADSVVHGVFDRRLHRGRSSRTPRAAWTSARCFDSTRGWRRSRPRCCRCRGMPT